MSVKNVLAGIAVNDLETAIDWYETLFDRAPDQRPMEEVAEWHFERGGWLQVFQDPQRAGRTSATLVEDDITQRIDDLKQKQISIDSQTTGSYVNIAIVSDPDGNRLVFAHSPSGENRSLL